MSEPAAVLMLPRVWVGNEKASINKTFFETEKITAVLNMTPTIPNMFVYDSNIEYTRVPLYDSVKKRDWKKMYEYMPFITEFIYKNSVIEGKNVLVHCRLGYQRSCTALVAYLMKYYSKDYNYTKAIEYCISKKKDAFNYGNSVNFEKSLKKWEDRYK